MTGQQLLTRNVNVGGVWYGPDYPDAGNPPAGSITNPKAYEPPQPDPLDSVRGNLVISGDEMINRTPARYSASPGPALMALTVAQLVKALSGDLTAANRGRLEALKRSTIEYSDEWYLMRDLLVEDVRPIASAPPPPFLNARPKGPTRRPLDAAALVWLQRLPADPDKISDDDLQELASWAKTIPPRSSDSRLIESVFGPGRRRLEVQHAQVVVDAVKASRPRLPDDRPRGRLEVLVAALRREDPTLDEDVALARAGAALAEARSAVTAQWEAAADDAERALEAVKAGAATTFDDSAQVA